MTTPDNERIHSAEELKAMIQPMREASRAFYSAATRIGNHAFIEFCGLMNEYIDLCEEAIRQGIDFTTCNTHTGGSLPAKPHHIGYLFEKLDCIYGPTIADAVKNRLTDEPEDPTPPFMQHG